MTEVEGSEDPIEVNKDVYECTICSKISKQKYHLKRHHFGIQVEECCYQKLSFRLVWGNDQEKVEILTVSDPTLIQTGISLSAVQEAIRAKGHVYRQISRNRPVPTELRIRSATMEVMKNKRCKRLMETANATTTERHSDNFRVFRGLRGMFRGSLCIVSLISGSCRQCLNLALGSLDLKTDVWIAQIFLNVTCKGKIKIRNSGR